MASKTTSSNGREQLSPCDTSENVEQRGNNELILDAFAPSSSYELAHNFASAYWLVAAFSFPANSQKNIIQNTL